MDDYTLISRPRALVPPTRPITFDEFLRDFDGHRAEWLPDGKVEILSEESVIAVQLRMDLSELLGVYLAATNWATCSPASCSGRPTIFPCAMRIC